MIPILLWAAASMQCHPVAGGRILGSDLAAASPAFRAIRGDLEIGYAPQPGARRFFEPGELSRIARANGLEASGVEQLCFEREMVSLEAPAVLEAMRKSLGAPLDPQIEIVTLSKMPVPKGDLLFPRESLAPAVAGDSAVWNGYVAYAGGRFPIWANVRIRVRSRRVVAVTDLRAGHVIEPGDIRMEEENDFPRRPPPLTTPDSAVGRVARRLLRAGTSLMAGDVEEPNDIDKGQTVMVEVRSGATILKLEATAESAGRRGDTISLRNVSSGKLFRARVEQKGWALLDFRQTELGISR